MSFFAKNDVRIKITALSKGCKSWFIFLHIFWCVTMRWKCFTHNSHNTKVKPKPGKACSHITKFLYTTHNQGWVVPEISYSTTSRLYMRGKEKKIQKEYKMSAETRAAKMRCIVFFWSWKKIPTFFLPFLEKNPSIRVHTFLV